MAQPTYDSPKEALGTGRRFSHVYVTHPLALMSDDNPADFRAVTTRYETTQICHVPFKKTTPAFSTT